MQSRRGLLEASSGGTVFLDEVGELSPRAQAKLLRTLQDGEIRKVGENVTRRLDLRVVAATNRTLAAEAAEGRFRHDLLYRLDVVHLQVPPLRDRGADIARLAMYYWDRTLVQTRGRARLAPETMNALAAHEWPGNVRELQNVLAALAVAAPAHGEVGPRLLPAAIRRAAEERRPTLAEARRAFDRTFVYDALTRSGGRRSPAARELGLSRQGLAKLVTRLGLASQKPAPRAMKDMAYWRVVNPVGLMVGEVYEALIDAGASGGKARAAAAAIPTVERLVSRDDPASLKEALTERIAALEAEVKTLKFAMFTFGPTILALLVKLVFFPG